MPDTTQTTRYTCQCGSVVLEASGKPIMTTACYCESCRKAGDMLAALPGAVDNREPDGSTNMVMVRKDRITCTSGAALLREYRLTPKSSSRRVVATCCNTPMFLEFEQGHWLSLYSNRVEPAQRPALDYRVMTRDALPGTNFDDSVPVLAGHSGGFMVKLFGAWAAMGFRNPKPAFLPQRETS